MLSTGMPSEEALVKGQARGGARRGPAVASDGTLAERRAHRPQAAGPTFATRPLCATPVLGNKCRFSSERHHGSTAGRRRQRRRRRHLGQCAASLALHRAIAARCHRGTRRRTRGATARPTGINKKYYAKRRIVAARSLERRTLRVRLAQGCRRGVRRKGRAHQRRAPPKQPVHLSPPIRWGGGWSCAQFHPSATQVMGRDAGDRSHRGRPTADHAGTPPNYWLVRDPSRVHRQRPNDGPGLATLTRQHHGRSFSTSPTLFSAQLESAAACNRRSCPASLQGIHQRETRGSAPNISQAHLSRNLPVLSQDPAASPPNTIDPRRMAYVASPMPPRHVYGA